MINELLSKHHICVVQKTLRKEEVLESFSDWIKEEEFYDWHLSLYRFATIRPLKYFNANAIDDLLTFFERYPDETLDEIYKLDSELSHSIFSMMRETASWGKEDPLSLQEPKDIIDFENIWHPEYQRYCEHIFNHLIKLPLGVLGKLKGKDYHSPDLANRAQILINNGLSNVTEGYNSVVRNAISHGGSRFKLNEIEYTNKDKKGNVVKRSLFASDFAELFDKLVDTCHSQLISILIFLYRNHSSVEANGLEKLPLGLRFLFIDSFSSHSGLKIISLAESQAIDNRKQLNIYCKINSLSRTIQIFECLQVAWNVLQFGGKDYNRIAISLDCDRSISSSLFINADRLREAINKNESLADCGKEIIETSLLWYDSSVFQRRFYAWKNIMPVIWKGYKRQLTKERQKRGLKVLSSKYFIRYIKNISTDTVRRIEAHVILKEQGQIPDVLIKEIVRDAIESLKKHKVKTAKIGQEGRFKGKPTYIYLRLYANDNRIRTLTSTGWTNKNLVLRAERTLIWRRNTPDLIKAPNAIFRRIRIEYNPEVIYKAS